MKNKVMIVLLIILGIILMYEIVSVLGNRDSDVYLSSEKNSILNNQVNISENYVKENIVVNKKIIRVDKESPETLEIQED